MDIREAQLADAPGIARVHIDSWRATYRGIVPADYLALLDYDEREKDWRDRIRDKPERQFIYVTYKADMVVGFAWGGPERSGGAGYDGELYAIYILEAHQRQGIGRILVSHSARRLLQEEMVSMLVWVLADNSFRKFYERLGGELVAEQDIQIGGTHLEEVGYGWRDIRVLAGMAPEA